MLANLIHPKLMVHQIKRFWPLWLAFFAAWTLGLLLPLAIFGPEIAVSRDQLESVRGAMDTGWTVEYFAALVGTAAAGLVAVLMVFDQLFAKPPAVFFGSIPVPRKALFFTQFLAGLLPLLGVELVVFAVLACMSAAFPAVEFSRCATWLELAVVFTLVSYATATLCAVLSGTRSMAVLLFALATGLGTAMECLLRAIADSLIWGAQLPIEASLAWLSPISGLVSYVMPAGAVLASENHLAAAAYAALALVAAVGCGALYKARNLEVAGAPLAMPRITPLLKLLLAAFIMTVFGFFGLLATISSSSSDVANPLVVAGTMVVGALVGSLFAQGVSTRSTRSLSGGLKYGGVLSLLCVAFVAGCAFDVLGIEGYVPDASQVESVELQAGVKLTKAESVEQATELHRRILDLGPVEDREIGGEADQYLTPFTLTLTYHMKDGSTIYRCYDCPAVIRTDDLVGQEVASLHDAYAKLESSYEARMSSAKPYLEAATGSVSVYVSGDQVQMMLDSNAADHFLKNVLAKDVKEHGASVVPSHWSGSDDVVIATYVDLNIRGTDESTILNLSKTHTPNSIAWLEKYCGKKLS